jgi:LacI family transcriptional regulator
MIFRERLRGYLDALKKNGITPADDLVIHGKVTIESGRECMDQLLNRKQIPDGVFAVEDFTALGAMQALKLANKKIPDEVAIIGFANEAFGKFISPSLSTVDQQTIKMGEEAARLFFRLSVNDQFYKHGAVKHVLEPELIFRESSLRQHAK